MLQSALDRRDSTRHRPITHAVTILSLILLIGIIVCTSILTVQANDSNPVIPSPSPSPSPPSHQPHIVTMSNTHSTSVGAESPSAAPSTVPASARGRFAWVMMHYEGTSKDDEYLLGLRVLIRSIQDTKTPYDIVVILSQNVRASTRATLLADGAILNEVPNLQNPFETKVSGRNSYKARFIYSLNKLYIWNMTQYERIAFLDSDNIFLTNMDEIFMCGHFCIVYMNPLIFHTGLIVVKPDESMFRKLLGALYSDESFSHDGADQGFLVAQFDVEHAPLFLPQQYLATGRPSEEPAMRLNIGWNINHFWYYIAFDWYWFFNAGAGTENEYPWIRDYRAVHSLPSSAVVEDAGTAAARVSMGKKNLVAGSSIAFCSGMMLKPWYWFPTMYFDHHYSWHQVRDKLNITYYPILLSRLAAFIPLWFIFQYLNNRQRIDRLTVLDTARNWTLKFFMVNPVLFGYLYGFACFLINGVIVFQLIPYVTPPRFAWSIWCFWHIALMYIELNLLVNIGLRPTANSQKRSLLLVENKSAQGQSDDINNTAATVTGSNALILLSIGQGIFFLSWAHIYPHFIVKIACFEYLLMCWIGIQTHVFRRATEAMCTAVKRQMGMQQ